MDGVVVVYPFCSQYHTIMSRIEHSHKFYDFSLSYKSLRKLRFFAIFGKFAVLAELFQPQISKIFTLSCKLYENHDFAIIAKIARMTKSRNSRHFRKIRSSCGALLEISIAILSRFTNFCSFRKSILDILLSNLIVEVESGNSLFISKLGAMVVIFIKLSTFDPKGPRQDIIPVYWNRQNCILLEKFLVYSE